MTYEIAALILAGLGAVWAFVELHSRRDIHAHWEAERKRMAYGASKFASPAERERYRAPAVSRGAGLREPTEMELPGGGILSVPPGQNLAAAYKRALGVHAGAGGSLRQELTQNYVQALGQMQAVTNIRCEAGAVNHDPNAANAPWLKGIRRVCAPPYDGQSG
jgi:hypothetical protein